MNRVRLLAATVPFLLAMVGVARAEPTRSFAIPAGTLDAALASLARQGAVDIGSADPALGQTRVPALRVRTSSRAALEHLLRGTPFYAVTVDRSSYRIVRCPAPRKPAPQPAIMAPSVVADPPPQRDVVVTASKLDAPLLRYPGSVTILQRAGIGDLGARAGPGFSEIAGSVPILQTTGLGAGRDKLFVRGVADSSFIGPTQSTATVYFGDVQLGYNGPDPSLSLYDVEKIEILEGPQGTLYGAGSIGGIVRLSPRSPDLTRASGHLSAGISASAHGSPSYDAAARINLPVVDGRMGLRAVAYRTRDGGYIDDVRRGVSNVNRSSTTGGRAALRLAPGANWTVDAGLVAQTIAARDAQYAQRKLPALSRASSIAQPFEQDYLLGRLVVEKQWDSGLRFLSASGAVDHDADDRSDATRRLDSPQAYDTHNRSRLYTQEVRLSRATPGGSSWLIGASVLRARDVYTREIGPVDRQRDIVGVTNRASVGALFGEATMALSTRLALTAGARATYARTDGEPIASRRIDQFLHGRTSHRVDPTFAASWLAAPGLAVFARYQSGFRTGGIAVAPGVGRVANFDADAIHVAEIGIRRDRKGALGFAGSASLSYADWDRIQADLIDRSGFPYTANVGTAQIRGAELNGSWVPTAGLHAGFALFLNDSRITDPAPGVPRTRGSRLPMSPVVSGSAKISYRWSSGSGAWSAYAGWRQVGSSMLGTQSPIDLRQRGYGSMAAGATWRRQRFELAATIDNVLDTRGNRFSSGNAFGVLARDEYTPLRPRTVRLGLSVPLGVADDAVP